MNLHPHSAPNEPVTLHEGPVAIEDGKTTVQGKGALVLRWAPSAGLIFEGVVAGRGPEPGARVKAEIAGSIAHVLVSSNQFRSKDGVLTTHVAGLVSRFDTGSGDGLASMGFQVVNFEDFLTPGPQARPVFGFPPRTADLATGGWRIRLSAVELSREVFRSLEETGGYAFTHVGKIERADAGPFVANDADQVLDTLRAFLSFARGAECNLPIRWGVDGRNQVIWERWGSPVVDSWKSPQNWFDEHHGNLLSEIFPAFAAAYEDADLGAPLKLALHWYLKSNTRAGGMEGSIVLGVTNLDLLAALVVVDRAAAMDAEKFDWLPAEKKLRMLLEALKAPLHIPPRYAELAAFAATNKWPDGAAALVNIRHGYVHANRKNRKIVFAAGNLVTFQAWQMSLWYQELALLQFLNHAGEYRNRVTAQWRGIVEPVPWA